MVDPALDFRPARSGDAAAILELVRHLGAVEQRPDLVTIDVSGVEWLIADPASPATAFVLEDPDGTIAGYMMLAKKFSTFKGFDILYIEDIVIAPSYKGRGLGKACMAYLADYALKSGARRLEWSAETVNVEAVQFYDHLGACRESGRVHFTMDADDLVRLKETCHHDGQSG